MLIFKLLVALTGPWKIFSMKAFFSVTKIIGTWVLSMLWLKGTLKDCCPSSSDNVQYLPFFLDLQASYMATY